jgi:hypothetical protein
MPSIGQENLETVMIDFLGALRRGRRRVKRTAVVSSRTGRPKRTRGPRSLQRRLEEHGAGAAVWPGPAWLTHTDVRIGGWLVEPGARHGLLAPAA